MAIHPGGILLIGMCAIIVVIGVSIIFFGQPFGIATGNKEPTETNIVLPTSTNMPVNSPVPAASPTNAAPVEENPAVLWPQFADPDEVSAEYDKPYEDRIPTIFSLSEEISENLREATLNTTDQVLLARGWCCTTQEILTQNMEHIQFILIINGKPVGNELSKTIRYYTDDSPCQLRAFLALEWPPGEYEISIDMVIDETIHDGWEEYHPGTSSYIYNVTVQP